MPPRADVIVNRNARRLGETSPLRQRLVSAAERAGARLHETRTLDELAHVADAIAMRGTDAVVLAGGDGSCMSGVSALARAFGQAPLPPIGIAPAGTVCTIARNLGLAGPGAAERVVRAIGEGCVQRLEQPTLRVVDDLEQERIGFIFGAGLVSRFFEVYEAEPRPGLASAASIAARVFVGSLVGSAFARRVIDPTRAVLSVDGKRHPATAWSLVLASVLQDVGLHFRVTYRAGEETHRFHVVASGLPPRALGLQMPRVLAGRPLQGEPRIDALSRSLKVDFEGVEGGYILDGERLAARAVTILPGPVLSLVALPPTE